MPANKDKAENIFNKASELYGYHRALLQLHPLRIKNDQKVNKALEILGKNIRKLHNEILELGGSIQEQASVLGDVYPAVYILKEENPVPYESGLRISELFLSNYRN